MCFHSTCKLLGGLRNKQALLKEMDWMTLTSQPWWEKPFHLILETPQRSCARESKRNKITITRNQLFHHVCGGRTLGPLRRSPVYLPHWHLRPLGPGMHESLACSPNKESRIKTNADRMNLHVFGTLHTQNEMWEHASNTLHTLTSQVFSAAAKPFHWTLFTFGSEGER